MNTSRTRIKDLSQTTKRYAKITMNGVLQPSPYDDKTAFDTGVVGSKDIISDTNHANFAKRIAYGETIMGDVDLYHWSREYSPGSVTASWPSNGQTKVMTLRGDLQNGIRTSTSLIVPDLWTMDRTRMCEIALVKAYAKMNASDIMSGETLTDLNKTVMMLRHPFKGARDLCSRIAKRKQSLLKKSGSNLAEANSNAWLELRYGWQPLLLDGDKIVEEAHKIRASYAKVRVARSYEESTGLFTVPLSNLPSGTPAGYLHTGTFTSQQQVTVSAGIRFLVDEVDKWQSMQRFFGLRPRDLLPLAWEKVPYSFVADWFTNIGTWIEAVTPNPGITVIAKWVTSTLDRTDSSSSTAKYPVTWESPYPTLVGDSGSGVENIRRLYRDTNPVLSQTPTITAKTISRLHSADAMSLALKPISGLLKGFRH